MQRELEKRTRTLLRHISLIVRQRGGLPIRELKTNVPDTASLLSEAYADDFASDGSGGREEGRGQGQILPEIRSSNPSNRGTTHAPPTPTSRSTAVDLDEDGAGDLVGGDGYGLTEYESTRQGEEEVVSGVDIDTDVGINFNTAEELSGPSGATLDTPDPDLVVPAPVKLQAEGEGKEEEGEESSGMFMPSWAVPLDKHTLAEEGEDGMIMAVAEAAVGAPSASASASVSIANAGTTLPSVESSPTSVGTGPSLPYILTHCLRPCPCQCNSSNCRRRPISSYLCLDRRSRGKGGSA